MHGKPTIPRIAPNHKTLLSVVLFPDPGFNDALVLVISFVVESELTKQCFAWIKLGD